MPLASSRVTWKGAISFGLVHIPIELRSGSVSNRPAFKWIDSKSASAVGNQRVSKTTGEEVEAGHIVKGVEVEDGQFVTLSPEEIRAALPKTTQTIEIEAFVDAGSIPIAYYDKPYHVTPLGKGQKAYALLRETLKKTGKAGIARVVISTKQHLAALIPEGNGLLLRWEDEVRDMTGLDLPGKDVTLSAKEMKMAEMLVNDLAAEWSPGLFHDEFKEQLQALIDMKAKKGQTMAIGGIERSEPMESSSAEIVDLTELLQRSLQGKAAAKPAKAAAKTPAKTSGKSANDANVRQLRPAAASKKAEKAKAVVKPVRRKVAWSS
jgi:DNA end-binding protein Ku